ncbi:MAG: Cys-rich peptide radical SAM maturase CcpM [Clostridia bacterium]|nr:Cys-rich peptide radical SAM maturase CcpM [Clostridia bacterium]
MSANKPFIHLFKLPGSYYMYDVNRNALVKLEESTYRVLQNHQKGNGSMIDNNHINLMKDCGLLSTKRASEIVHPDNDLLDYYLNNKVSSIALQLTQQCNLRCRYCTYSGNYLNRAHSNKEMDFQTAKKGIDFAISHSRECPRIFIGFYGGEPLLRFDLIKECIEYSIEQAEGKELGFNITTNATLLNEEIIEYFEKYKVNLMISLDGPKHVHNKNRVFEGNNKGTFEAVIKNLENIKKRFPAYFKTILFNAVLDPQNDFGCTSDFFTNYETIKDSFVNVSEVNTTYLKDKQDVSENYIIERNYERFKYLLSKINRLDEKYISKLVFQYYSSLKIKFHDERVFTSEVADRVHHGGPCIPGVSRLFMNAYGDLYPCERVSESSEIMKIGNIGYGFDIEKVRNLLNIGSLTAEKCKNCWAFKYCYLCATAADDITSLSPKVKMAKCEGVRATIEDLLKDYCALKELGHTFEDDNNLFYQFA